MIKKFIRPKSDHCLALSVLLTHFVLMLNFIQIDLSKLLHGFLQKITLFLANLRKHFLSDPSPIIALSCQSVTAVH